MAIHQVILNTSSENLCLPFDGAQTTIGDVKARLCKNYSDGLGALVLSSLGGKILNDDMMLFETSNTEHLNLLFRLRGGKGGFGSMLRAQGGRMNAQKTTNFEACRDLQGRRIKSVNEAKRLEEELAALPQREQEKRERLQKKIDKALKEREPRKHLFDDHEFLDNREQMVEGVKNAVSGLLKRPHPSSSATPSSPTSSTSSASSSHSSPPATKRQKTQSPPKKVASVFDDEDSSDESDESDDNNDEPAPITATQVKGKGKGLAVKAETIKV